MLAGSAMRRAIHCLADKKGELMYPALEC